MEEIWKDIIGYEGYYQISSHGRVRSLDRVISIKGQAYRRKLGRILKQTMNPGGYFVLNLSKNGIVIITTVHKLVAIHFVRGYKKGLEVNHKDENRQNNHSNNLEWITHKENINYGTAKKRLSQKLKGRVFPHMLKGKLSEEEVKDIFFDKRRYHEIASDHNVGKDAISRIKNNRTWKHLNLK